MKKYYYVLFILIFSSLSLNAETTNTKLNELFIQLKECNSQKQSKRVLLSRSRAETKNQQIAELSAPLEILAHTLL